MGPFLAESLPRSRFLWSGAAILAAIAGSLLVCAPEPPAARQSLIRPTHCFEARRAPVEGDFVVDQVVLTKLDNTISMRCLVTVHGTARGAADATASSEASVAELAMTRNACITAAVESANP